MLATMRDAVQEYALGVGRDRPLQQWILSDYDTWEPNPHYIGPDLGHPENDEPRGHAYATFKEAAQAARDYAVGQQTIARVEHYKNCCWVLWF